MIVYGRLGLTPYPFVFICRVLEATGYTVSLGNPTNELSTNQNQRPQHQNFRQNQSYKVGHNILLDRSVL